MGDDASLDDFLDADDDQQAATGTDGSVPEVDETADAESAETEASDGAVDVPDDAASTSSVEPAVATYDWTPDGAACEACAEVVERRWRDGPGYVCESCKDW